MNVLGIDIGSRAVKMAAMKNGNITLCKTIDTAKFYRNYCRTENKKVVVNFSSLFGNDFNKIVSTGYGRNNVNIDKAEVIIELKAHCLGASWQTGLKDFTLLDIGGQDSKVMLIKNGKVADMVLNDKCAASCGRYLENMANVLGIDMDEMNKYSEDPVELSSTCAVFGESELIGRISEGNSIDKLAAGVNYSLFKRIKPIILKFPGKTLVITGGVAKNKSLYSFITKELDFKHVIVPAHPQLNGAIGCCAYTFQYK